MNTVHKSPKRLKNLKITEVSSVDRGAGEGVQVVLSKRHDDTQAAILKGFNALHESVESILMDDDIDKNEALAETFEQATDYFHQFDNTADPAEVVSPKPTVTTKGAPMPDTAYAWMMSEAKKLMQKDSSLTEAQAFSKVYTNPAYRELANSDRAARRSAVLKASTEPNVAKAKSSAPISDRVHSRAAAVGQQFPGMSHADCVQAVLGRDKILAAEYQREQQS
jgi:hypothetical protein